MQFSLQLRKFLGTQCHTIKESLSSSTNNSFLSSTTIVVLLSPFDSRKFAYTVIYKVVLQFLCCLDLTTEMLVYTNSRTKIVRNKDTFYDTTKNCLRLNVALMWRKKSLRVVMTAALNWRAGNVGPIKWDYCTSNCLPLGNPSLLFSPPVFNSISQHILIPS